MGSIDGAHRANVKLTGDARWDFWESGLVATAALILLAILMPPLSTYDRTTDVENSLFSNWAQIQQRINHPGATGVGRGGIGTTGFSTEVKLSGPLMRTRDPVFTYTTPGGFTGTRYFRGVDVTLTIGGEWRYPSSNGLHQSLGKNQVLPYAEDYPKMAMSIVDVTMKHPPIGNEDILFYPGQLVSSDRVSQANQVPMPGLILTAMWTVDRLNSITPSTSFGAYKVVVASSGATTDDLRGAGTKYPDWVQMYASLPTGGRYRSATVLRDIHNLALKIVNDAGAVTPFDQASAIEAYLRSDQFKYMLQPPSPPPGTDPIDYFLNVSHKGYCEYFATAMGDMLRSLGIPTRLVNGYGPGQFDNSVNAFVVRGEDAHTWVESYFPGYGWIPFEPTRDAENIYQPIQRGTSSAACIRENGCSSPSDTSSSGGGATVPLPKNPRGEPDPGQLTGGFAVRIPDAGTLTTVLAVLVAIVLLLLVGASRYLRPRTVMGVWNRMLMLARFAGAQSRPGETPRELSQRLQETFPEASEPVGSLASGFAVAAYAPPEVAETARSSVMESWSVLRPMLLRRVFRRFRPR
jgi:hypothetical protein